MRGAVNAAISYFDQPATDVCIGHIDVKPQTSLLQRGGKWHAETALEVSIEPFYLTLGLGSIGTT
jgi:hypothetical protein